MYIWVLLATFMAILYSYNLSPRQDMRKLEVEPVAEAIISKLVIKQKASGLYMRAHTPPYATYKDSDGNDRKASQITYISGLLTNEDLESYLPFGFNDNDAYRTEIYCADSTNQTTFASCNGKENKRYLVGYTVIPQRWLNVVTGLPNNDFTNALKTIIGNDKSFGYAGCYEEEIDPATNEKNCKTWAIRSKEGFESTYWATKTDSETGTSSQESITKVNKIIPPLIADEGGFASRCGSKKTGSALCLMYLYEYRNDYYAN